MNDRSKDINILTNIAEHVMVEKGFIPDFPNSVMEELVKIQAPASPSPSMRDMRNLLWVSIDNDDSLDLDQLTYAEQSGKVYVAIADVDALVKPGSAIDQYAGHNTTSVYTPTKVFPMLPHKLSNDLTSLNENADRCAIVTEVNIENNGTFSLGGIYPALVRNHAKLTYNGVGAFLEVNAPLPNLSQAVLEQLKLQDRIAQLIKDFRKEQGSLSFVTTEYEPVIENGIVVALREIVFNRAHEIIENFMIASNASMAHYMTEKKLPTIRRIVRTPKRWDRIILLAKQFGTNLPSYPDAKALESFLLKQLQRDPESFPDLSLALIKLIGRGEYVLGAPGQPSIGHFDLALHEYAHTTAPNRRYPDLIMQRILKGNLYHEKPPYTLNELDSIANRCTEKETDATKVERRMRKSVAALLLQKYIGKEYPAIVTGTGEKGTWVRLKTPPVEGKLIQGTKGLDVGDRVKVKLVHVDIARGFIDFIAH